MENLTETQVTTDKIYSGCILDFYRDTVRLPNGGTAPRELTRHVGAVCIVPLLDDGRVIVERQFRYPVNEVITEIPAGKRDSRDEAPDVAARRELREETGITARELIPLGPFYPAAAYSDEVIWMYLARGLTFGEQQLDDDEFLNLQAVPLEELARDVLAGRIPDAKTQAAILRVYAWSAASSRNNTSGRRRSDDRRLPLGIGVRSVPAQQPLFLIGNAGIARERVAELGKDRVQLRLRDRRLGEDDRLAPAVRGRDLLDRKRIAHRVVDVALAHGAHHAVYIQCDLIHGIPP